MSVRIDKLTASGAAQKMALKDLIKPTDSAVSLQPSA
ncbi:hypothetical protein PhaeoP54_00026 [Phaeobacter inhibens]|nr:hypothetical protein PhaeoP54_00026 [Phaeobacter inhibens]